MGRIRPGPVKVLCRSFGRIHCNNGDELYAAQQGYTLDHDGRVERAIPLLKLALSYCFYLDLIDPKISIVVVSDTQGIFLSLLKTKSRRPSTLSVWTVSR